MGMSRPIIHIVDTDAAVRDSATALFAAAGYPVACHDSGEAFLAACGDDGGGCVILETDLGALSGFDVLADLARRAVPWAVVFLSAKADIPMAVRAMKAGAADFLQKPAAGGELLACVETALRERAGAFASLGWRHLLCRRLAELTPREREIMELVAAGLANKAIARLLGISHRTVETHRSRVLHKTAAASVVELARMVSLCAAAGYGCEQPPRRRGQNRKAAPPGAPAGRPA